VLVELPALPEGPVILGSISSTSTTEIVTV